MRNVLGPGTILGYCTNVHPGRGTEVIGQLRTIAPAVKARVSPSSPMGIGLWFPRGAIMQVTHEQIFDRAGETLSHWLRSNELLPFTINGFPLDDFHAARVKHSVYQPSWAHKERSVFTRWLGDIHVALAGDDDRNIERSISTLPVGWPGPPCDPVDLDAATDQLLRTALHFKTQREAFGVPVHLDLEPEPGCILQRSEDVIRFFQERLLPRAAAHNLSEEDVVAHVRICHDICHAAVMFEDQAEMFDRYRAAGIKIGKVQISNAVRADLAGLSACERTDAIAQLRQFSEDRYLHQTMIRSGDELTFFEDLPLALKEFGTSDRAGDEWRVHFHVPVYLERFGLLQTTRDRIIECMRLLRGSEVKHWEVETYAWNVLPAELQVDDLSEGIAREMQWVIEQAQLLEAGR